MNPRQEAHAARQFEQHLNALIASTKKQLAEVDVSGSFDPDVFRTEFERLVALEACRYHALTPDAELTTEAENGYRIINNHLEGKN